MISTRQQRVSFRGPFTLDEVAKAGGAGMLARTEEVIDWLP